MDEKQGGNPGVIAGDRIYCRHPKLGAISAPVLSVGKHGVSIPHESGKGAVGVRWNAVLGHQKRRERKLKVLEEGEDGFIAEDDDGQRVYVRGGLGGDPDDGAAERPQVLQKALLLDVGPLSCGCTDHALETLHKAMSEDGIQEWAQHESPFIRELIEKFTEAGLLRSATVRDELAAWISGAHHVAGAARTAAPAAAAGAWSEQQIGLVRVYLEALAPEAFRLDDWGLLIDYLAQRYMPASALADEAQMLVARAAMMGRVEAYLDDLPAGAAATLLAAAPATVASLTSSFAFSDAAAAILEYARLRAADAVVGASEALRIGLRRTVLEHQQRRLAGDPSATPGSLEQSLFDRFGKFNRDWRMIAVTEAGEVCNQGVIASLPPDSLVRRLEQYHGACPFCRKLDGRVFRVTTADDPDKNGAADVWPGKTNIGRSAAPRKRVGDELVPRLPEERWWAAAGTQHPHCRGRWEPLKRLKPGQDPAFERWMMQKAGVKFGLQY